MNKRLLTAMLVSSFASVSFAAQGPNPDSMNPNGTTGTNTRSTTTAPQGENMSMDEHGQRNMRQPNQAQMQGALSDANLQRSIHEQIMNDDSLSMRARGVTVSSENGKVTLKGSVASNEERSRLEEIAKSAKGTTSVENQTQVESF